MKPVITILIPNFKTPEITKLCLRLIRKNTDLNFVKIIVIDNDSQDESTQYLRSLKWIELIERKAQADDTPPLSHSRALDLALKRVDTPYVLSLHTDTLIRRHDWLAFLLSQIEQDNTIAGVGSWKLEIKPRHKLILKKIESAIESAWYKLSAKNINGLSRQHYLRSHCALYRTDLLRSHNLTFSADKSTAGKVMHEELIRHGYKMIFLPSEILIKYLVHLNHATMVLNPDLGSRPRSIRKGHSRIRKFLNELQAEKILADESLDQVSDRF